MRDYDLFGDLVDVTGPSMSAGRRQSESIRKIAAAGLNPLVGTRGPEGHTCGECVHREVLRYHDRAYPKCLLGPRTHGTKTDVRRTWPACHRFEELP